MEGSNLTQPCHLGEKVTTLQPLHSPHLLALWGWYESLVTTPLNVSYSFISTTKAKLFTCQVSQPCSIQIHKGTHWMQTSGHLPYRRAKTLYHINHGWLVHNSFLLKISYLYCQVIAFLHFSQVSTLQTKKLNQTYYRVRKRHKRIK
jgi:hypothetical protein